MTKRWLTDEEMAEQVRQATLASLTEKTVLRGAEVLAELVREGMMDIEVAQAVLDEVYPREDE